MHQIPLDLASLLASKLGLDDAVETGTYLGGGALRLKGLFSRVFTVEISSELHQSAIAKYGHLPEITFLQGSSEQVLPRITAQIGRPALFWLDGHWSPGLPMTDGPQCPIMEEIRTIDSFEFNSGSCILIDDAHLFLGAPPPPHRRSDWPTLIQVIDLLRLRYPRVVTVLNNVIIAGPPEIQDVLDDYWLHVLAIGGDVYQQLFQAQRPTVPLALARLVKSVARAICPEMVKSIIRQTRVGRASVLPRRD